MMATFRPAISDRSASFSYNTLAAISGNLPFHGAQAGCLALELRQRDPPGALELHDPIRTEQVLKVVDLRRVPVEGNGDLVGTDGQDLALEDLHELEHLAPDLRGGAHRRQQQLALHGLGRV